MLLKKNNIFDENFCVNLLKFINLKQIKKFLLWTLQLPLP